MHYSFMMGACLFAVTQGKFLPAHYMYYTVLYTILLSARVGKRGELVQGGQSSMPQGLKEPNCAHLSSSCYSGVQGQIWGEGHWYRCTLLSVKHAMGVAAGNFFLRLRSR